MPFTAAHSLEHDEVAGAIFNARVIELGLEALHSDAWATSARSIDLPGERIFLHATRWGRRELIRDGDLVVDVGLFAGQASVAVAGRSEDDVTAAVERLRELLPAPDPSGAQEVTVTFWTYGPHGPQPAWRTISVKTFALRALAWEWREWCELHYIVDPDSFFGQHADYLMHVLLQTEWEESFGGWTNAGAGGIVSAQTLRSELGDAGPGVAGGEQSGRDPKGWRLLVLEDTGELLQPDAKAVIGQGLSRFLNVADGLIGQGLRVLVLVTTNEEIRKLHPAVARPGRSAATVRFDALAASEASAWLAGNGFDAPAPPSSATIAELYARLEGRDVPKQSIGFEESAP